MIARCKSCKLPWNISIKTDLTNEYECPKCEAKRKKELVKPKPRTIVKPKKKKKSEGRISSVLLRNRSKFSISNNS